MLVCAICDIFSKVKLTVKVLRNLGTSSGGANPLEEKEYEEVNDKMKYCFTYKRGGKAI